MMTGSFCIDFRWGDRKEPSTACAGRANAFLQDLEPISKAFTGFVAVADQDRRESFQKLDTNSLRLLLEKGVKRRDLDRSVIEDLGFSTSLVNQDISIAIRLHCGVFCGVVPNTCTVEILKLTNETRCVLSASVLSQFFQAAVRAWEPERGLLTSMKLWEAVPQSKKVPNFGWLTYLSTKYSIPHAVRTQFEVKPINGAGNLISAIGDDTHLAEDQDTSRVQELVTAFTSG